MSRTLFLRVFPARRPGRFRAGAAALLALAGPAAAAAAQVRRPPAPRAAAAPRAAGKPAPAATRAPAPGAVSVAPATLGPALRALGYRPAASGGYQRLRVEEAGYGYFIDVSFTPAGDWLVCMAHLASLPAREKTPGAPLLALLATNDQLVGMAFSYDPGNGRLMLNATVPTRALDRGSLKNLVEGMKGTIRQTERLWDAAAW